MVHSRYFAFLAAATAVVARTPPGFSPASNTDLIVEYRGFAPSNGVVVARNILMIDLDIPTDSPPATNTLLHWMQTGLTPAAVATQLNTTTGTIRAFLLENSTNTTPIVAYFGPNPPARIPLSHRYTQILVDTSDITTEGVETLRSAAATLRGFSAQEVLDEADLADKVVAGNFYNVTNPGPAASPSASASGTGTGTGTPTGTGTGTAASGSATSDIATAAGVGMRPGTALAGIAAVGAVMLAL